MLSLKLKSAANAAVDYTEVACSSWLMLPMPGLGASNPERIDAAGSFTMFSTHAYYTSIGAASPCLLCVPTAKVIIQTGCETAWQQRLCS